MTLRDESLILRITEEDTSIIKSSLSSVAMFAHSCQESRKIMIDKKRNAYQDFIARMEAE